MQQRLCYLFITTYITNRNLISIADIMNDLAKKVTPANGRQIFFDGNPRSGVAGTNGGLAMAMTPSQEESWAA